MSNSVSFDRAAEYYDATRGLSDEGIERTTGALTAAFDGAGPVIEIGVGTGQVALPLHEAGVPVVGIDLSRPMLSQLLAKSGGSPPFPLAQADATSMPFPDDTFGGAYLRWVLHLIPDWSTAVGEIARVTRPGGTFLAALGSYGGKRSEMQSRFQEITGVSVDPIGLGWDGWDRLEGEMASLGARRLPDLEFEDLPRDDLEVFTQGIERNMYSWTWAVHDDDLRGRAAEEVRRWAEERWGPLGETAPDVFTWRFARYRLGSRPDSYSAT
jgi:SAM-dependent methyltransferase